MLSLQQVKCNWEYTTDYAFCAHTHRTTHTHTHSKSIPYHSVQCDPNVRKNSPANGEMKTEQYICAYASVNTY